MKILLVNDDGIDSPALLPTIKALEKIGEVIAVIPKYQQSWTGKSNTRRADRIEKSIIKIEGREIIAIDGLPADCANYGLHMDEVKPDIIVSGANVGHNLGLSTFFASGTIGAALEGLLIGIPSIAVSCPYDINVHKLSSDEFENPLKILPKIVSSFLNDKPDNVAMLQINLPINVKHDKILATHMDNHAFGPLFADENDGFIYPIFTTARCRGLEQ